MGLFETNLFRSPGVNALATKIDLEGRPILFLIDHILLVLQWRLVMD
jgi:hypothetical protein